MSDVLQVVTWGPCCDGRTWAVRKVVEYFVIPASIGSQGRIYPDPVYRAKLDAADAERERRLAEWHALPWYRRAVTRRPYLFMPIWREMFPEHS